MQLFTGIPMLAWLVLSGLFFAAGEFFSKRFALVPGVGLFLLIILVDVLSVTAWLPAIFERSQLSVTGVIWSVISLMLTVVIGVLFFQERLTLLQSLGLLAGFVSVVLLSL